MQTIRTKRLLLRDWQESDLAPFAALNADPRVMEFFPAKLSWEESLELARKIRAHAAERGFGLWAVEVPGVANFIGFVGLAVPTFQAAFTPCVEVGWRLAFEFWGQGFAKEAASLALEYGFLTLNLNEIVS